MSRPVITRRPGADGPHGHLSAASRSLRRALVRAQAVLTARRDNRGALAVLAVAVTAGGVLAAVLGARSIASSETSKARIAFRSDSQQIASTLKLALQHEEDLVISASAYITSNPHGSPAQFDRWANAVQALKRYPELLNIGLVKLVLPSELPAFERFVRSNPVLALGPGTQGPAEAFEITPPGRRPYYCFAVDGLTRNAASYIPAGADYCALAPQLVGGRDSGQASYAPFQQGGATTLGISTPVYRGGRVPSTVAGRRRNFVGWLGELLTPQLVVQRALQGYAGLSVSFRYDLHGSHGIFRVGRARAHARSATVNLHNGWRVSVFGAPAATGLAKNTRALTLLVGGSLVSVLFGLLVAALATGRRRALALVQQKTRELSHQALHDSLTGLPNRALVLDRAAQLLARTSRRPGVCAGALFIDVDGFKHVNDNLGHAAGDQLLKAVGERLQSAVRDDDTVGRLGGDEFVVLVESDGGEALNLLADRLTEVLREPVELRDGRKLFSVTASIGVAIGHYETSDALLRDADLALYSAKAAGKDRYALFEPSMYEGVEDRLALEADLGAALKSDQFHLLYQPIFELESERSIAVEALIRWQHPERGVINPDQFIPLAEESGMIIPIGRWVLEQACRQCAVWRSQGLSLGMSVNVSAQQLGRRGFIEDVRNALRESAIDPAMLTLEITETTLTGDIRAAGEHLRAVKELGVRVAIDDFGTGYASLSQLRRLPVDILKIDRSFVAALRTADDGAALLQAIIGVGRALSLSVLAEGIEEPEQLRCLREMGCELAQGFLLGRPAPSDRLESVLRPVGVRRALDTPARR